jgi:PPOX class probable F420-dependent enzyme
MNDMTDTNVDQALASLTTSRYVQLRTYRRDGSAVDTPIWFVLDGDVLAFRTKRGPKTQRIAANPQVEVWPCDFRGRYPAGVPTARGRATIVDGSAAEAANAALHRRYGWQHNVVPLLRLPGVKNVHQDLPLREKLRRATMSGVWPDSAIVEVTLDRGDAAPEGTATPRGGA